MKVERRTREILEDFNSLDVIVRGNEDKMTTSADDLCIRSLSVVRETASKSDGSPSLSARDSLKRVDMQGLLIMLPIK